MAAPVGFEYIPLPNQERFHKSDAKFRAYIGGFGSGKTLSGCQEVIQHAIKYPGTRIAVCRKTIPELKTTTMVTFFETCPPQYIRRYWKQDKELEFINGSVILFKALEGSKSVDKVKSLEISFFMIDEASELDEEIFLALSGRPRYMKDEIPDYRRGGVLTSNPPPTNHWIYELFVSSNDPNYFIVRAPTNENPYLPDDYEETLRKLYPPEWVKVFLNGEFGFLPDGQPVYSEFVPSIHVKEKVWNPALPMQCGWDFGYNYPAAVICQIQDGKIHIFDVIEGNNELIVVFDKDKNPVGGFGKRVKDFREEKYRGAIWKDYGDPAGTQKSDKSEFTSISALSAIGITVGFIHLHINQGIMVLRILIHVNDGESKSSIDPLCKRLIEAFSGAYCYKKGKNIDGANPEKDGVYDHAMDALRYLVTNQSQFLQFLSAPVRKPEPSNTFMKVREKALKAKRSRRYG